MSIGMLRRHRGHDTLAEQPVEAAPLQELVPGEEQNSEPVEEVIEKPSKKKKG